MSETINCYGTDYTVSEGKIKIQQTLSVDQAAAVEEVAPEAVSIQEALGMLTQDAVEKRRSELRPDDIENASDEIVQRLDDIYCHLNSDND